MGTHDGHRARMKARFKTHGLDNFDDHNVLELLLFYTIPRRDTNEIAHALLKRFGNLTAVFEASIDDLTSVPGVGESSAVLLRLIPQATRRYLLDKSTKHKEDLSSSDMAGNFAVAKLLYEPEEVLIMMCLDSCGRMISHYELARGDIEQVSVNIRRIAELAMSSKAISVILAHNHLSGSCLPSREDEQNTSRLRTALGLLGVNLADHIVVSGGEYTSMAESGYL